MTKLRNFFKKINNILANRWVNNALLFICSVVFVVSLFYIARWFLENRQTDIIMKDAADSINVPMPDYFDNEIFIIPPAVNEEPNNPIYSYPSSEYLDVDFSKWINKNSDTVGWVWVKGTKINYPVVQAADNDYYLNRTFDKKISSAGWMFGDYRNDFVNLGRNTIIYGHARIDRSMLGSLYYTTEKAWREDPSNLYVRFNTLHDKSVWQVFSVYVTKISFNYIKTSFASDKEYTDFLKAIKNKNTVPLPAVSLGPTDRILTFSTCVAREDSRLVMHAKLIKSTSNSIKPLAFSG